MPAILEESDWPTWLDEVPAREDELKAFSGRAGPS
jgi:hypothetical protein